MKTTILLTAILVVAMVHDVAFPAEKLGCPKATAIADALANIQKHNWNGISAASVMSIWPTSFDELRCDSQKPCRLLVSKNRVIGGHCECCETFQFDIKQGPSGSSSDRLRNIIIHYAAYNKSDLVRAAEELLRGAGLPEDKRITLGRDPVQRFEWTSTQEGSRQSYLAETQITRVGSDWEFYLSVTADAD
jgi:hypothetical protein